MIRTILALLLPSLTAAAQIPDLGPHVHLFSPAMPSAEIQRQIDAVYARQQHAEFGPDRDALLFTPGAYQVDIPVGYYTEVLGLGVSPDDTHITGNVHADASLPKDNATCVFWRAAENFSLSPTGGTMQWAVSQAVPFRRMHILGNMVLHQHRGWASGGWMSDDLIDGNVDSGSQQQWIARNTDWGSWTGASWNMLFLGDPHPPAGDWPKPAYTKVAATPVIREKPYLALDAGGHYIVRVPAIQTDTVGITWRTRAASEKGAAAEKLARILPLTRFYIAHPERDTAATLNAQLARGKHLLLTPGLYPLTEPLRVTHPGTVVLGLGFATLQPIAGTAAMLTADVDGLILAGLLFDAGPSNSPVLLQVGRPGSHASHAQNPISLHDLFFRIGGAGPGRATVSLEINANSTLIDHTWIWRADHGAHVGWTENPADTGLVVNGQNVTAYGLFVEHFQQFQVLWNGDGGRTYFYQSEIPYDPPNQPAYTSIAGTNGYASYKLADTVTTHEAWGLGVYSVFHNPGITLTRAIEVPTRPTIRFHHMVTLALDRNGAIEHVINNTGDQTTTNARSTPRVTDFP